MIELDSRDRKTDASYCCWTRLCKSLRRFAGSREEESVQQSLPQGCGFINRTLKWHHKWRKDTERRRVALLGGSVIGHYLPATIRLNQVQGKETRPMLFVSPLQPELSDCKCGIGTRNVHLEIGKSKMSHRFSIGIR